MSERLERQIETALSARTGRDCLFTPSGRLALHLAFRALLSPGDRILMSPLEDDAVFFGALAAGLRPVMAPVSVSDGNIDPDAVPEATWSSVAAVLTMNMYGVPDRILELRARCDTLGIPFIEDAAHAIETDIDSRPIGTFGTLSAFSFSKHIPGVGGALAFGDGIRRSRLAALLDELTTRRTLGRRTTDLGHSAARRVLDAVGLGGPVRRVRQALRRPVERATWRIPLRAHHLEEAVAVPRLDRFETWMTTAYPDYRMGQRTDRLRSTLDSLRDLDRDRQQRIEGVLLLRQLDAVAPVVRDGPARPLLRVPLLIRDRDLVAAELMRRGINVYFLYDPPLDDYAGPRFAEPSAAPEMARWWARHVLPVDPHDAERVLDAVGSTEVSLIPAAPQP